MKAQILYCRAQYQESLLAYDERLKIDPKYIKAFSKDIELIQDYEKDLMPKINEARQKSQKK